MGFQQFPVLQFFHDIVMRSSAPELIQKAWRHVRNSYQNNPVAKEWVEGKVEAANTENKWEQKLGAVKAVIR